MIKRCVICGGPFDCGTNRDRPAMATTCGIKCQKEKDCDYKSKWHSLHYKYKYRKPSEKTLVWQRRYREKNKEKLRLKYQKKPIPSCSICGARCESAHYKRCIVCGIEMSNIRGFLCKLGLSIKYFPPALLESKRLQIQLHRAAKEERKKQL